MATYTIELTEIEQTAMEYVAADVNEWIQNVVHERARIASDQMVSDYINAKLVAGEPLSGTRDDIIMNGGLPSAQARNNK